MQTYYPKLLLFPTYESVKKNDIVIKDTNEDYIYLINLFKASDNPNPNPNTYPNPEDKDKENKTSKKPKKKKKNQNPNPNPNPHHKPSTLHKPTFKKGSEDEKPNVIKLLTSQKTKEEIVADILITKINVNYEMIMKDLENGKKDEDWIWWIFPTSIEGMSEYPPKTYINKKNLFYFLRQSSYRHSVGESMSTMDKWIKVLERILTLISRKRNFEVKKEVLIGSQTKIKVGSEIIPQIDHARIAASSKFFYEKIQEERKASLLDGVYNLLRLMSYFHLKLDWGK